jgi:hypothetical protein
LVSQFFKNALIIEKGQEANVYLWYKNDFEWQLVPNGFIQGGREVVQNNWTLFKHLKLTSINEIKKAIGHCGGNKTLYGRITLQCISNL